MSALWERGLREGGKPSTILQDATRLSGVIRMPSCFRVMLSGRTRFGFAGGRFARMQGSAGYGSTICDTRRASHAVMSGENLPLVGQAPRAPAASDDGRLCHLADGHLVEAAEKVGNIIAEAMGGIWPECLDQAEVGRNQECRPR